jgi:hypothetical protein
MGLTAEGSAVVRPNHQRAKGDFDAAEALITDCRKTGDLSLDICAEDDARATIGLQDVDRSCRTSRQKAARSSW